MEKKGQSGPNGDVGIEENSDSDGKGEWSEMWSVNAQLYYFKRLIHYGIN